MGLKTFKGLLAFISISCTEVQTSALRATFLVLFVQGILFRSFGVSKGFLLSVMGVRIWVAAPATSACTISRALVASSNRGIGPMGGATNAVHHISERLGRMNELP